MEAAGIAKLNGMEAITFAEMQYYLSQVPSRNGARIDLLGHEFVHSMQYDKLGYAEFLVRYAEATLTLMESGLSRKQAYMQNQFEVTAEAFGRALDKNNQLWQDFLAGKMKQLSNDQIRRFQDNYITYYVDRVLSR